MNRSLDREAFRAHVAAADGPCVVRLAVTVDAETTPLGAYAALTGRTTDVDAAEYAFLLESGEKVASSDPDGAFAPSTGERHARYSFVGYDPAAVVTVDGTPAEESGGSSSPERTVDVRVLDDRYIDRLDAERASEAEDVLDALRRVLPDVERRGFPDADRQQLDGGLVGFLAYDAVYDLWLDEVGVERPDTPTPDAQFVLTTKTLAFDEREGALELVFTPVVVDGADAGAVYDDLLAEAARVEGVLEAADVPAPGGFRRTGERADPREPYEAQVRRAKEHVLDGDIYQGVVSRERELRGEVDPLGFYEALRSVNPSPYMYLLGYGDRTVVGASPETLVSVHGDRVVANPIAGTCPRGASPVEDRRLAGEMLADEKERAEHTMLVDLARNDVRRVATPGSIRVEEFMTVVKYSHVQHIESTVTGTLRDDRDAFDATRAAFPAGTLAGAPKMRAMELIDAIEETPRGLYGGGVGYYSWTGDADVAIVIRTALVEHGAGEDRITVRAGAGVVADSEPAAEFEETERKMDGVLTALERIRTDDSRDGDPRTDADAGGGPNDRPVEPEGRQ